jgi:hypothetical protein
MNKQLEYHRSYYQLNKERIKARVSERRLSNVERIREENKRYREENLDLIKAKKAEYYRRNKEKINRKNIEWSKHNRDPAKRAFYEAGRRSRKKLAQPTWASKQKIQNIYKQAKLLADNSGEDWQVDHIVPLQSKFVCGLHCEANLQVFKKLDNLSKGNRHWPDMWE